MTVQYFPFDAGAGANITEAQWGLMGKRWLTTGVFQGFLLELQPYGDSSGMQVKVRTGGAWVEGFYYDSDAEQVLAIAAAHATLARIDRVVLRLDRTANTIAVAVLTGTAAGSPVAPALTQSATTVYEMPLAQVAVAAAAAVITAGNVTDQRSYAAALLVDGSVTTAKLAAGVLSADATGRAKMATGFVTTTQILDGTILTQDLADGSVSAVKLATGAKPPTVARLWALA